MRTIESHHLCIEAGTVLLMLAVSGVSVGMATAADMTVQQIAELRAQAKELLGVVPDKMPGGEKDSKELIALGKKLYFEKQLSMNKTMSCNTCHMVDKGLGGVDNEPTSEGIHGKRGDRNSPTVLNAGFQFAQFWDGRAEDLVAQAKGPVLNPVEMAMPSEAVVVERLRADKDYAKLFRKAFPDAAELGTYDNMARAIAAFERTLITHDRLDDFQKGKDKALSGQELGGLQLFLNSGCTTCHHGPVLGGNSYMKSGLVNPYEHQKDEGRFVVTKDEDDKYKFKVPMLRNVALTFPYFHDGKIATLEEAVKKMGWMQLGKEFTADEVKSLVAFLQSLSGKNRKGPKQQG